MLVDRLFLNPWYFWHDVRLGRGTAYFYSDPVTPEDETLPPATPSPAPPKTEIHRKLTYRVKKGDTLISIAKKYYGDGRLWKAIYMENQTVLTSPDSLKPGQVLAIPPVK